MQASAREPQRRLRDVPPDLAGPRGVRRRPSTRCRQDVIKKISDARDLLEKTLTEWVEAHPEHWDLLLSRFDRDPKRWPKPEIDGQAIDIAGIPAVRLQVTAPCANLTGVVGPCEGRMFLFVVRKRLYRLAMWKWATPKDREHLRDDLDMIELSFDVPKKEAIPKRPDAPKGDGGGMDGGSGGPGPDKPDAKKEVLKDLTFGFEVVKPAKFTARELDRSTVADRVLGFEFKAQSGGSDVFVDLQVYWIGRAGSTAFDIKTYLTGLWSGFLKQHPEGVIATFPFPPVSVRSPFLSLPDMTKKKELKRPPEADKDKTVTVGDMKEAGVAAESKGIKMGTETMHETWRWCMTGNEPRRGEDTQVQYCFSTGERTFVIRVTARKDGWTIWKDDIAEVVRSFTIKDPAK